LRLLEEGMEMSSICTLAHPLQFGSDFFAVLAAITWLWASRVKGLSESAQEQMTALHGDVLPVLERLMTSVAKQSKLNASAALFAALSAFCQLPQIFMHDVCL
jgi:hypothetical protein